MAEISKSGNRTIVKDGERQIVVDPQNSIVVVMENGKKSIVSGSFNIPAIMDCLANNYPYPVSTYTVQQEVWGGDGKTRGTSNANSAINWLLRRQQELGVRLIRRPAHGVVELDVD